MSGGEQSGCVFCRALAAEDAGSLVLFRGVSCFVVLNLFPYNNGHLMIVPNRHIASLAEADPAELSEMMALARRSEIALGEVYRPHGLNLGMNLGRPAGAGVVDHIHMHLVPRWIGDTNFMTVVSGTRVIPEEPQQACLRLRPFFAR